MKIYLIKPNHPIYESLIKYPPKNIQFINVGDKDMKNVQNVNVYKQNFIINFVKKILYRKVVFPRIIVLRKINVDLIYSTRGFIVLNYPCVIDFEHVNSFYNLSWNWQKYNSYKVLLKKLLLRDNIKYLLPYSYWALNSLINALGKDFYLKIKEKIEVLYPAVEPHVNKSRDLNKKEKITLLFVGRDLFRKGGNDVLLIYKELKQKYDIELIVRSNVSKKIKRKFNDIKFVDFISREELLKLYEKSDIFVYPSRMDTFGYVLLEAMSFALPIVTSNYAAIPEIVKNYENGLIVDVQNYKNRKEEIRKQLKEKIIELIENSYLYKKFSKNNLREVFNGRFSINERNKKLTTMFNKININLNY